MFHGVDVSYLITCLFWKTPLPRRHEFPVILDRFDYAYIFTAVDVNSYTSTFFCWLVLLLYLMFITTLLLLFFSVVCSVSNVPHVFAVVVFTYVASFSVISIFTMFTYFCVFCEEIFIYVWWFHIWNIFLCSMISLFFCGSVWFVFSDFTVVWWDIFPYVLLFSRLEL